MSNPLASAEARQAAEKIFSLFKNASYFSTRNEEHREQMLNGWAAIIAESYADLVRTNVQLRDERDNAYALVKVEDEHRQAAESLNRELVEVVELYLSKKPWKLGVEALEEVTERAEAAINSATPKQGEGKS